jgi:hypothetical protein
VYPQAWYHDGDIHVIFTIRGGFDATPIDDTYHVVYFRFDTTNDTWYKADGTSYAGTAISYTNADFVVQGQVGSYMRDVNVDASGKLWVLYSYQTTNLTDAWWISSDMYMAEYDSGWTSTKVYDGDDSEHGTLIIDDDDGVTIVFNKEVAGSREMFKLVGSLSDLTTWTETQLTHNTSDHYAGAACVKRPSTDKDIYCINNHRDSANVYGYRPFFMP